MNWFFSSIDFISDIAMWIIAIIFAWVGWCLVRINK